MVSIDGLLQVSYSVYDSLFLSVVSAGPYVSLTAFSTLVAVLFSIAYWYFVDQEKVDDLKSQIEEKQEKRKELQENNNEEELSEMVSEVLSLQQKLMIESFKPTIGMMVLLATFFPWLGATYAPAISLESSGQNNYTGTLEYGGSQEQVTVQNTSSAAIQINGETVSEGDKIDVMGITWQIAGFGNTTGGFLSSSDGTKLKLNLHTVDLPLSLPFIGNAINWLGFYILVNMPITFVIRRAMGLN